MDSRSHNDSALKYSFHSGEGFFLFFCFLIFSFLGLSLLVGNRSVSVGTDTLSYIEYFRSVDYRFGVYRFEFLFHYLTLLISWVSNSPSVYLAIIFIIFNLLYFSCYLYGTGSVLSRWAPASGLLCFSGVMLLSSWYLVATTNGLRQGLALPLLYLSIISLYDRRYIQALLLYSAAAGFHLSVLLVLPFVFLIFFSDLVLLLLFIFSSLSYYLGASEYLVKFLSNSFGLALYDYILAYGQEAGLWVGFQIELFLYTVFWGVFFYACRNYIILSHFNRYVLLSRLYIVLTMPYFFFGFSAFSNRYAFISWLLLPVLQAFLIQSLRFNSLLKGFISLFLLLLGFCHYSLYILGYPLFLF